jgi:peroxiredoxin-like protein
MKPFPHHYLVNASASQKSAVDLDSSGLKTLASAPPSEFDGPGDLWSPETLFVAAVCDCFVLTFRAIANSSRLNWTSLVCDGDGTVDRTNGVTSFTGVQLRARLVIPVGTDEEKATRLLEKAEKACLISNSLKFTPTIEADVAIELAA